MTRRLSNDERDLWERLRRSVRPLRGPSITETTAETETPKPTKPSIADGNRPTPPAAARAAPAPALAPLVTLEERARRRLSRGLADVDGRIDLHGMRQDRAFHALFSFLRHAQARGARTVLVITGKGRGGDEVRGVLRQTVPSWLGRPEFRALIAGFEEATRRHGGAGALYVRVRRRREGTDRRP